MAFKSKSRKSRKSRKCKRSQKRVKSYTKRSGKKVRSFCRRKSNRKSRSIKRRSPSRKKCPPNKKAIRSYRRKSGKRVKSYCRKLYYYPNGQVVQPVNVQYPPIVRQPVVQQPAAPQRQLGYEYDLPVLIPNFDEQKEGGRKYEKKEGQRDVLKKDIENVMEQIKRCGEQGKMYSSKLKQCVDRPVIKQQDRNEIKDLMGKIKNCNERGLMYSKKLQACIQPIEGQKVASKKAQKVFVEKVLPKGKELQTIRKAEVLTGSPLNISVQQAAEPVPVISIVRGKEKELQTIRKSEASIGSPLNISVQTAKQSPSISVVSKRIDPVYSITEMVSPQVSESVLSSSTKMPEVNISRVEEILPEIWNDNCPEDKYPQDGICYDYSDFHLYSVNCDKGNRFSYQYMKCVDKRTKFNKQIEEKQRKKFNEYLNKNKKFWPRKKNEPDYDLGSIYGEEIYENQSKPVVNQKRGLLADIEKGVKLVKRTPERKAKTEAKEKITQQASQSDLRRSPYFLSALKEVKLKKKEAEPEPVKIKSPLEIKLEQIRLATVGGKEDEEVEEWDE